MARKLALKTTELTTFFNGVPVDPEERKFDYGEMMQRVLFWTAPPKGLVLTEVEAALAAFAPIKAAIAAGESEVTLTEEQWKLLRIKIETFPWGLVDPVILEFGMMIREASEIT